MKAHLIKVYILFLFQFVYINYSCSQPTLYGIRNYRNLFELIRIDCATDSLTVLGNIPLNYYGSTFSSSFNYDSLRYIYCTGLEIFIFDANNFSIIDSSSFSSIYPNHFNNIVYNPKDGYVYGILQNIIDLHSQFAKYDLSSKSFVDTLSVPLNFEIGATCVSLIDTATNRYIIQSNKLTAFDLSTFQLAYNSPLIVNNAHDSFTHMAINNDNGKLYGLYNDNHANTQVLCQINDTTGQYAMIGAPLSVVSSKSYLCGSVIDVISNEFYFATTDGSLIGVDITTGSLTYSYKYSDLYQLLFLR